MAYAHGLEDKDSGARVTVDIDFYYLHKGDLWTHRLM